MNVYRLLTLGLTYLIATSALAQWQWIDKDGRKVFSDRPPPSEILDKNILKRPAGRAAPLQSQTTTQEPSPAPAAKKTLDSPQLSGVDKDLLAKKKLADDAEAAKKKEAEEKLLKARVENCARAKGAKATFDSGVRVSRTNEKGDREIMDEAARASEVKRIQGIIESDCQ